MDFNMDLIQNVFANLSLTLTNSQITNLQARSMEHKGFLALRCSFSYISLMSKREVHKNVPNHVMKTSCDPIPSLHPTITSRSSIYPN
jgi:hypothetical protein